MHYPLVRSNFIAIFRQSNKCTLLLSISIFELWSFVSFLLFCYFLLIPKIPNSQISIYSVSRSVTCSLLFINDKKNNTSTEKHYLNKGSCDHMLQTEYAIFVRYNIWTDFHIWLYLPRHRKKWLCNHHMGRLHTDIHSLSLCSLTFFWSKEKIYENTKVTYTPYNILDTLCYLRVSFLHSKLTWPDSDRGELFEITLFVWNSSDNLVLII